MSNQRTTTASTIATATLPAFSSFSSAAGATASEETSAALLEGYKAEVQQLREALYEVTHRDTGTSGGGGGGGNSSAAPGEALEGRYLAAIKKNKTLSIQLSTTQHLLAVAQKALEAEREKTQRLAAAVTASTVGHSRGVKKGVRTTTTVKQGSAFGEAEAEAEAEAGYGSNQKVQGESGGGPTASTAATVARLYDQLHQKELATSEVLRENAALRQLVQREIGLRDDTAEVDYLLRRVEDSTSHGSCGWRGRAEEIVVLKGKLKDAQRERDAAMIAAETPQGGSGAEEEDGIDFSVDGRTPPTALRELLGVEGVGARDGDNRSNATGTTTITTHAHRPRRDVDDEARDRIGLMQQQRAVQQRKMAADLAQQQLELSEERKKGAALQARVKTMKSELDTLRGYVDAILEKSATDDELVAAYKEELHHAMLEARRWQREAATAVTTTGTSSARQQEGTTPRNEMRNGDGEATSTAAAEARGAPCRTSAPRQKSGDDAVKTKEDVKDDSLVRVASLSTSSTTSPSSVFTTSLYAWVREACQPSPLSTSAEVPPPFDGVSLPASKVFASVLRHACQHVALVERSAVGGGPSATTKPATRATEAADMERVLLQENALLKKRLRALSELMEKELEAQRVLWSSVATTAAPSADA